MQTFECIPCGYTTNKSFNIIRHNSTMKHLKIIQMSINDKTNSVKIKKQKVQELHEPVKELIENLNGQIDKLKAQNKLLTKKHTKKRIQISKSLKKAICDKYIGSHIGESLCLCCELQIITQLAFHCGHIIPESKGGLTHINNILPICATCNHSMSDKEFFQFKKMFVNKQSKFEGNSLINFQLIQQNALELYKDSLQVVNDNANMEKQFDELNQMFEITKQNNDKIHSQNIIEYDKKPKKINKKCTDTPLKYFICRFCKDEFKYSQGLSRHENHRCKKRNDVINKMNEVKTNNDEIMTKNEIIELKTQMNILTGQISMLLELATKNADTINVNAKISKKSLDIMSCIV